METPAGEIRPDGVCLTCGRTGCTIEAHHPAGEHNVPEITVPACTPGCHELLTEGQLTAGVKLDRRLDRSETERRWALLQGLAGVVALLARHRDLPEVEAALDQAGPSLGRLLSSLVPAEWGSRTGAAGDVGPDPRRRDRRQELRERQGTPLPTPSGDTSAPSQADELARCGSLVGLLAETEQRLFGEDTLARIDPAALLARLGPLAEGEGLDRFVEWGEQMAPHLAGAAKTLGSAEPADLAEALEQTRWLARLADDATAAFAAVADPDGRRPEALLAALMGSWPPARLPTG